MSSSVAMDISVHLSTITTTNDATYTNVLPSMSSTATANPTVISLNVDYSPPHLLPPVPYFLEPRPTSSSTTSSAITASANPSVISQNNNINYCPPHPPPLVPCHPESSLLLCLAWVGISIDLMKSKIRPKEFPKEFKCQDRHRRVKGFRGATKRNPEMKTFDQVYVR